MSDLQYEVLEKFEGKTISTIVGAEEDSQEVTFEFTNGEKATFMHYQDCCEDVHLADILGDIKSLIGAPLTYAKIATNQHSEGICESTTETYYIFKTDNDPCGVTFLWRGESNGWYSEDVDIVWGKTAE